ncbi:hypothetical protein HOC35_03195 [Candidatus Woesearchaeota archaeon]|jgi:hypothetical protein|nr:hypothetical protein [Candidatus Woesearchaeota archaeon]
MSLVLLFDDVNGITPKKDVRISSISKSKPKLAKTETKKSLKSKKDKKQESKKTKKDGIAAKIIEMIEELAEIEDTNSVIEDHIKSIKDNYSEIFHVQQYQQQLAQYTKFLNAYLKGYEQREGTNGVAIVREYDDAFERTDVIVPKRDFEAGQEVMTNSEIRDIVRRKRMNWAMGGEHNHVSPDEKERYKMWKICNKFNYIMAEGGWFSL